MNAPSPAVLFRGINPAARQIIQSVLVEHAISTAEFFGDGRKAELRDARADAARRLKALGISGYRIARILARSPDTVHLYLNTKARKRKLKKMREVPELRKAFRMLAPDTARIVEAIMEAEGVDFDTLSAQWISERANYEAEAKAREAA